jgi:ATP-binding cassette subfamily F protein 3
MHSVELLAEALNKYEGSYILVSHDRYFISKTANKIWEIVDNQIKEFKGTYQEWIEWNERMAKIGAENAKNEKPEQKASQPIPATASKQVEKNPINKDQQKELQQLQKQLQQIESNLNKAKIEKLRIEAAMGDPNNYSDKAKFVQLEIDYKKTQAEWNSLNQDYEQIFEKIMELETRA